MGTGTKVGITASVLVALALTFFAGVSLDDGNAYYCESRALVAQCDGLSSTEKSCYYQDSEDVRRSKICTLGWVKVINDIVIEPVVKETEEKEVITYQESSSKQWSCSSSPKICRPK